MSVFCCASRRTFGLSADHGLLGACQLLGGLVVRVDCPGVLAHVRGDLLGLVLDHDASDVLGIEEHGPGVRLGRHLRRVVVDLHRRPGEGVSEVQAFRGRPPWELARDRVERRGDLELVDVPGVDEPLLVVLGHPERVARDQVQLASDLAHPREALGVAGQLADARGDASGALDLVELLLVEVVAPRHEVERSALGANARGRVEPPERDGSGGPRRRLEEAPPGEASIERCHGDSSSRFQRWSRAQLATIGLPPHLDARLGRHQPHPDAIDGRRPGQPPSRR